MKKALLRLVVIPLGTICIMLISFLLNSIYPPQKSTGQTTPPMDQTDRDKSKAAFENLIQKTKEKAAYIEGQKSVKAPEKEKPAKAKIIVVENPVRKPDPFIKKVYRDSVFVSNGVGVEKPIIIYAAPPVYSPNETKYMTFSEWRAATGETQEKKYRAYLKSLSVIK